MFSRQLGVGIVGLGPWGRNLARVFGSTSAAAVKVVCDVNPGRLQCLTGPLSAVRRTTDFNSLLADDALDAIVLATPPETHVRLALDALNAGKHVFVEKPLALSFRDALRLARSVENAEHVLMVGHVLLYHPAIVELGQRMQRGNLGRIRSVHCVRLGTVDPDRAECPWWTLAPHDLSAATWLLRATPTSVVARPTVVGGSRAVHAVISFSSGLNASVTAGMRNAKKVRRLQVVGSRRIAIFDDTDPEHPLRIYSAGASHLAHDPERLPTGPFEAPLLDKTEPLALEVAHFINSAFGRRSPRSDIFEGLRVVAALAAGAESLARGGAAVAVPVSTPGRRSLRSASRRARVRS